MKLTWTKAVLVAGALCVGGVGLRLASASGGSSEGQLESLEAPELRTLLMRRESEMEALRHRLDRVDDSRWYREAERLGIAAAVERIRLPDRQRRRIAVAIVREAHLAKLDPRLVFAVIAVESRFNPYAVSNVGARGLMQVMPATGAWLLEGRGSQLVHPTHLFDAELNVELGTSYLAALASRFGSLEAALVAYNAGPAAARRMMADPSTRRRVLAGYPRKVRLEWERLAKAPMTLATTKNLEKSTNGG